MMTAMPLHHGAGGDRWSRANVKEVLPELPSPLFMHQLETVSGPRMLAAFEVAGYRFPNGSVLFGSAAGRPYLNIGLMRSMMADIGLPPELTDHALGRGTDLTEPSLQWNWTRILCRLPTIFSALFRQLRAVPATMRWFSRSDGILAEFSLATMRTLRQASDEVLLKDFDRAATETRVDAPVILSVTGVGVVLHKRLSRTLLADQASIAIPEAEVVVIPGAIPGGERNSCAISATLANWA